MTPSRLVIGIGNPSRGDDALGPECIGRLQALALPDLELLTDFQLQVEYLLDFADRREVIFIDAAASGPEPYSFEAVTAARDRGVSTHAVPPQTVLAAYEAHFKTAPPPAHVMAIRGYRFELGAPLSPPAAANLAAAVGLLHRHLSNMESTLGSEPQG